MKTNSLISHLIAITLLPFTVTIIIPSYIFRNEQSFVPDTILIKAAGAILMGLGLLLFAMTLRLFISTGKGTLAPWDPPQNLIVKGPYRHCRNPMICGVLFILVGESFLFRSADILTWAGTFFIINNIYFLVYEEPGLLKRFGSDYEKYKKNVPRWIPKWSPYNP